MTKELKIAGMSCEHCAGKVKSALEQIAGVTDASVSLEAGSATVVVEEEVTEERFASAIAESGYVLADVR